MEENLRLIPISDRCSNEFTVKVLEGFNFIDPETLQYKDKPEYVTMTKYATKGVCESYLMGKPKLNKDLYELDPDIWKALRNKKLLSNSCKNNLLNTKVIISGSTAWNTFIGETSYMAEVFNIFNDYILDENLSNFISVGNEYITLVSIDKDNLGIAMKYHVGYNWVSVFGCSYDRDSHILVLEPTTMCDSSVGEDIELLANKDFNYGNASLSLPETLPEVVDKLKSTFLSAEEVITMFKKILKIKLKITCPDMTQFAIDHEDDYSENSIEVLKDIIDSLYGDTQFISTMAKNYLKKSIYITGVSYYTFLKLLSSRFEDGAVDIDKVYEVIRKCNKMETHADYLK